MNPNRLYQCNHNEKGMIFPKDREGNYLTLGANGETPSVSWQTHLVVTHPFDLLTFPCLNRQLPN